MAEINTKTLRKLAKASMATIDTPGLWYEDVAESGIETEEDANLVEALSPWVVIELLDRLEAAEAFLFVDDTGEEM